RVDDDSQQTSAIGRIQEGINLATAGGTVHVSPGTYTESPYITKSLSLIGANRDTTTVNLLAAGGPSAATYLASLQVSGQNVTISGLTIVGNSAVGSGLANSDIYIEPALASVSILDNRLKVGQIGPGSNGDDGMGILTTYTTAPGTFVGTLNVTGNDIVPTGASASRAFYINPGVTAFHFMKNSITGEFDGRAISQANSAEIVGNTITGNGTSKGIGVWGYPDAGVYGYATIANNDFRNLGTAVSVLSANN